VTATMPSFNTNSDLHDLRQALATILPGLGYSSDFDLKRGPNPDEYVLSLVFTRPIERVELTVPIEWGLTVEDIEQTIAEEESKSKTRKANERHITD
jgi:hypothetical protein